MPRGTACRIIKHGNAESPLGNFRPTVGAGSNVLTGRRGASIHRSGIFIEIVIGLYIIKRGRLTHRLLSNQT